jgi:hypothetical protein
MVAVCLGLLRSRRWAWPPALIVLIADAVIVGGLLRLLLDVGGPGAAVPAGGPRPVRHG